MHISGMHVAVSIEAYGSFSSLHIRFVLSLVSYFSLASVPNKCVSFDVCVCFFLLFFLSLFHSFLVTRILATLYLFSHLLSLYLCWDSVYGAWTHASFCVPCSCQYGMVCIVHIILNLTHFTKSFVCKRNNFIRKAIQLCVLCIPAFSFVYEESFEWEIFICFVVLIYINVYTSSKLRAVAVESKREWFSFFFWLLLLLVVVNKLRKHWHISWSSCWWTILHVPSSVIRFAFSVRRTLEP